MKTKTSKKYYPVKLWRRVTAYVMTLVLLLQILVPGIAAAAIVITDNQIESRLMANYQFQPSASSDQLYERAVYVGQDLPANTPTIETFHKSLVAVKKGLPAPTYVPIAGDITVFVPVHRLGKVVGDTYVQNRYVRDQITDLLGRHMINAGPGVTELTQNQALYEAAYDFATTNVQGYIFGKPIDAGFTISRDMIWPEWRVINGQSVLVPMVYLSNATLDSRGVKDHTIEFAGHSAQFANVVIDNANLLLKRSTFLNVLGDVINKSGTISAEQNLNLNVKGSLQNLSGTISAKDNISIVAGQFSNKTIVHPYVDKNGSGTRLGAVAGFSSENGSISIKSYGDILVEGATVDANNGAITFNAAGNIIIKGLATNYATTFKDGDWQVNQTNLEVFKSYLNAKETIQLIASGSIEVTASDLISTHGGIELLAENGIHILDELNQEQIQKVDRKGKTTGTSSEFRTEAVRAILKAGKGVLLDSEHGDVVLKATEITSADGAQVTAKNGTVHLLMTKELEEFHLQTVRKSTWTIKTRTENVIHENNIQNAIVGGLQVQAMYGVNVEYTGEKGASIEDQIDDYRDMPGMEWMAQLHDSKVATNWAAVDEIHKEIKKTKRNLSPAAMAIVAIAVAVATGGAASGFFATIQSSVASAAVSAGASSAVAASLGTAFASGFVALSTQAAQSLAAGNSLGDTINAMDSNESLKSLAVAMATAGAMNSIPDVKLFDIPNASTVSASSIANQTVQAVVNATVQAGVGVAINGGNSNDYLQAFKTSLATNAVNTIGQKMSTKIGDLAAIGDLDTAAKYIAHAGVGCLMGVASAKAGGSDADVGNNCATGAGGATIGEYVGDLYKKRLANDLNIWSKNLIDPIANPYDPRIDLQMELLAARGVDIAKLTAALGAFFSGADVNIAALTSTNAAKYNATDKRHRTIYRWVDKNGAVHFGDRWPAGADVGIDLNTLALPEASVRARAAAQQEELDCIFNRRTDCTPEALNLGDQLLNAKIREEFPDQFTEEAILARKAVLNEIASMNQTLKQTSEIGCTLSLLCGSVVAVQEVIDGKVVTVGAALVVIDIFGNKILKTGEAAIDSFKSAMKASGGPKNLTPTQTDRFWNQIDDEMIGMPTYNVNHFENGRNIRAGALNDAYKDVNKVAPYKEGTIVKEFFSSPGTKYFAIEYKTQLAPGVWSSTKKYSSLAEARKDLALTPDFKKDNQEGNPLVVREYTVNANVNLPTRTGTAGKQTGTNGIVYEGGGTQFEFVIDDIKNNWSNFLTRTAEFSIGN